MVLLFLSEPSNEDKEDRGLVKERISVLEQLERIISSIISTTVFNEARIWLCDAISHLQSITPRNKCRLFEKLLREKKSKRELAPQLIRMIIERRPERAASVVAKRCIMLESFFEGNPRRILEWFNHFASTSESGHKKGARALSQFAFINRDICWEELEWRGKHGQSPAVVATKPHYLHDLDVLKTVENFIEHVPEFWSSEELADSLKDGEIFYVDEQFFVEKFVHLLYEEDADDIWAVVCEFLTEEKFSFLSQRLLILLDRHELHIFLNLLARYISSSLKLNVDSPYAWLEILLSSQRDDPCKIVNLQDISLNVYLLLSAVISHGRKLLRLLVDVEHDKECRQIDDLLREDSKFSNADHWLLMKECLKLNLPLALKLIALQSWTLHFRLSKECKTKKRYESLFSTSSIQFKAVGGYSLLQSESIKTANDACKKKVKDKLKRKRHPIETDANEEFEFELSGGRSDVFSMSDCWLLSTDGYSCTWYIADLPEHLSSHYFTTWLKWLWFQISK